MPGAYLWAWSETVGDWVKVKADVNGKLIISDADPFTIQQTDPNALRHAPYGFNLATPAWLPFAVDALGRLRLVLDIAGGLDDLDDVTLAALVDGHFLSYSTGLGYWQNRLLATTDIPNLAASKITSGRFGVARLPALTDNKFWKGTGTDVEEVFLTLVDIPATARDFLRIRRTNRYHTSNIVCTNQLTGAIAANYLYAIPFYCPIGITVDRIAVEVTVLAAGAARLGIYSDDGDGLPSALVLDAGTVNTGTTGVKEIAIDEDLVAGTLYWLVIVADAAATYRKVTSANTPSLLGQSSSLGQFNEWFWLKAFTYAALPNPYPTDATLYYGSAVLTAVRRSA